MICGLFLLTDLYPLALAWRGNRQTTLVHALGWATAAWLAWIVALVYADLGPGPAGDLLRYAATCLTGCTGVAVLGARRPGATAWNFVVLAQLAVLLLPIAEGLGELRLDALRLVFLGATLAVGAFNYLPTRLAAAVVCLAIGCGAEVILLASTRNMAHALEQVVPFSRCLLAASPWFAWVQVRTKAAAASEFDRLWLGFRDRFGLVWGLRVREQFTRAAMNAGWPVILRWAGLRLQPGTQPLRMAQSEEIVATLRALLKRFGPEEGTMEQETHA